MDDDRYLGALHLLAFAANLRPTDSVLVVFDSGTADLVKYFQSAAGALNLELSTARTSVAANHGQEPDRRVAERMIGFDVVIALTTFSLAHSQARIDASEAGARFLSLPQYSEALLGHPMVRVDYRRIAPTVAKVSNLLTMGNVLTVTSRAGTNLTIDIQGRSGNNCPAFLTAPGDLGSPPDIEANVSPVETGSNGIAVIDGSITHPSIGLLRDPVLIDFDSGVATRFTTRDHRTSDTLRTIFDGQDPARKVLAELGVGLNPEAVLTGVMLSDEGTLGTAHLGLGSNFFVGGLNRVDFHLDFVMRDVTVTVDGVDILRDGQLVDI